MEKEIRSTRTHRKLLVYNYAVSFNDHDDTLYMEWHDLKRYCTRNELIMLIRAIKAGGCSLSCLDTGVVRQVIAI